ncbi:TerC family protein [Corticimicrobacter populi]|uniref:Transporter-associated domain-containing protein n=1 Tax=Corticimicrobacter populi TaxID=2175229 RepID=A0A2V1JZK6_9BURK|nr:TerC family protein [Corticimicrobacter populi]PWF22729.1 hypothetical protein DD235_11705 [Corticimicrobacter populi]QDQ86625.1 TerC family protein [Alcaligenaceae bacterium SJ-26]
MEWLLDPAVWVGLLTLVVLEIVLGIDNLIFIAILADKLPPHLRDRARIIGLSLALIMRLGLLSVMSWLVTLTAPLFSIGPATFSGRDLILIVGGFFLLFKGTMELHDRIEGHHSVSKGPRVYASFWVIVTQIVLLDAVFSLDAVITAVGMVDHLSVMMAAVIIAIGVMLVASKPLTRFVNAHPTVVVLCLGFLLMIGFSLVAEGFGFKVPKGYLYAAIGFSVAIEALNQVARRNMQKAEDHRPMRDRTSEAILRMLGKRPLDAEEDQSAAVQARDASAFGVEERNMVSGVLTLAERSVYSVMTPRTAIEWLNVEDEGEVLKAQVDQSSHSFFPVGRGSLDDIVGVVRAKDAVADLLTEGRIRKESLREPVIVHESIGMLRLMETLKSSGGKLVLVTDEFGAIVGLVTPIDVFETIAGEFPDEDESPDIVVEGDNLWRVDGAADLHQLEQVLDTDDLVNDNEDYTTLAGYLLARFGQLPEPGDHCEHVSHVGHDRIRFEVLALDGRRISQVQVRRIVPDYEAEAE